MEEVIEGKDEDGEEQGIEKDNSEFLHDWVVV